MAVAHSAEAGEVPGLVDESSLKREEEPCVGRVWSSGGDLGLGSQMVDMDAREVHKCRETAVNHHDLFLAEASEDDAMATAEDVIRHKLGVSWFSRPWP